MDKNKHWLVILSVLILLAFLPISFRQFASALTGNYNKASGDQLTITDWNNLDNDFVARSGGAGSAMSGVLDMGNNRINNLAAPIADTDAVTRGAMNTAITSAVNNAASIKDTSGNSLRMVCGNTPPGTTNWQTYPQDTHSIQLVVDTSAANFTNTPRYFAYLRGSMSYVAIGTNQIYSPTATQFTLHVVYLGVDNNWLVPPAFTSFITPTQANSWQWTIYWCAIGN